MILQLPRKLLRPPRPQLHYLVDGLENYYPRSLFDVVLENVELDAKLDAYAADLLVAEHDDIREDKGAEIKHKQMNVTSGKSLLEMWVTTFLPE